MPMEIKSLRDIQGERQRQVHSIAIMQDHHRWGVQPKPFLIITLAT